MNINIVVVSVLLLTGAALIARAIQTNTDDVAPAAISLSQSTNPSSITKKLTSDFASDKSSNSIEQRVIDLPEKRNLDISTYELVDTTKPNVENNTTNDIEVIELQEERIRTRLKQGEDPLHLLSPGNISNLTSYERDIITQEIVIRGRFGTRDLAEQLALNYFQYNDIYKPLVLKLIGSIGNKHAIASLVELYQNVSEDHRFIIHSTLAHAGGNTEPNGLVKKELRDIYLDILNGYYSDSALLREAAIRGLISIGDAASISNIMNIYDMSILSGNSQDSRSIEMYISNVQNPESIELLTKTLKRTDISWEMGFSIVQRISKIDSISQRKSINDWASNINTTAQLEKFVIFYLNDPNIDADLKSILTEKSIHLTDQKTEWINNWLNNVSENS